VFHLPDLPNAGYATARERELSDTICMFMRDIERDRFRLLTIVIDGPDKWRKACSNLWRGLGVETESVDEIYRYFTLQAARPVDQRRLLEAMKNPDKYREVVKDIMPDIEAQRETVRLVQKWS
jgi:hypothetical protein